ncbi:MAG: outer membrane protein assembly factor BamB [Burkholderiaceae bacterium]|nr:outer membrane protein assembly factor BamB [Burkholderiaceae bacterium]
MISTNGRAAPVVSRCLGRWAFLILFVGILTGCSIFNGSSSKMAPLDLGPNVPLFSVRQVWTSRIGGVTAQSFEVHASGDVLTLASLDGTVVALDPKTGADIWRLSLGEPLSAGVGSDGKWTAVVSRSNQLVMIESGREIWRKPLSTQTFTSPLVAGDRVFVLAADRSVSSYDATTGQRLWSQSRPGESLVLRQSGVLTAVGDTLVVGLSGRLVGLNPLTGNVRWEVPLAVARGTNDVERLVDLVGRPSRVANSFCVRAFQAAVGCIDSSSGRLSWIQTAHGITGLHGDSAVLFGSEANGSFVAWRRGDGTRLWTTDRLKYRKLTAPLLLGRSVVVADDTGLVHLLAKEDGSPMNRLMTDASGVAMAPVVISETLVVVTRNGGIYGFRPD